MRGQSSGGGRRSRTNRSIMEHLPGDHDLLNLRGSFIDPQGPNLAVEALDRRPAYDTASAEQLERPIDDLLRRFGGEQLRHCRFSCDARRTLVAGPCRAINEERRAVN